MAISGNIDTLKESRDLLDEITLKIKNIEKGYVDANNAQKKGLEDGKKQIKKTKEGIIKLVPKKN